MRARNSDRITETTTPVPVPFSTEQTPLLERVFSATDDVVGAVIEVDIATGADRRVALRRLASASWRLWQLTLRALEPRRTS
jgi:hypothetical protein